MKTKKLSTILIFIVGIFFAVNIINVESASAIVCKTSCDDVIFTGCHYTTENKSYIGVSDDGACSVGSALQVFNGLFLDASCSDAGMSCKESNCSGLVAPNGTACVVTMGRNDGIGCPPGIVENFGSWDASQGKCVKCNGKVEERVCADGASIKVNNITWLCQLSNNSFETACDATVATSCDDKLVGDACNPPVGGTCDASGVCVAAAGLSLAVSASATTISTGGTSTITFTVTKGVVNVAGATVGIVSVIGGLVDGALTTSCTTGAGGTCTVIYTAPAVAGAYTINAQKASKLGETDSGPVSIVITVNSCLGTTLISFVSDPYVVGDTIQFRGRDTASSFAVCLYDPSGSLADDNELNLPSPLSQQTSVVAGAGDIGLWTGTIELGGVPTCPATLAGASSCIDTAVVGGAACTPNGGGCIINGDCCSGNCSGGTCAAVAVCVPTGPEDCTVVGDEDCANGADCADSVACPDGAACVGTNICNGGICQACSGEGVAAASAAACCTGLNLIAGICTSACDPNAWFFCNPLRGSVETIVQAGETLLGYILGLIGSVALLFIIVAGVMYMTSAGNEERISSSKKILSGAVIGLMIALLAYGLLHVIMTVLGM